MITKFILPVVSLVLFSCDKKNDEPKSSVLLLTQKTWMLSSVGVDDNNNGVIDQDEESIRDCEKDNRYTFYTGGSGLVEESTLKCDTGFTKVPFTWKLINDNTAIDFTTAIAKILRLTEHELVTYHEINLGNPAPLRFMTVFRH